MAIVEVRSEHLAGMHHRASWNEFTFESDEPAQLGGEEHYPIPLAYFTASVGFCAMTQVVRFAEQMKVPVDALTARVSSEWDRSGSILTGTVQSHCLGFRIDMNVESGAAPEHVAAVIQNAHAGCFAEQALRSRVTVVPTANLNGAPLESESVGSLDSSKPNRTIKHFPISTDIVHTGGVAHEATWEGFKFSSDEPPHLGGQDEHPIPIAYFVGSVGFCALTQIVRYARQLDIPIESVTCESASHFSRSGSVLAGTIQAECDQIDVHVDVMSRASSSDVAHLLRLAHSGCYAQQALLHQVSVESDVLLNGESLDVESYPRRITHVNEI